MRTSSTPNPTAWRRAAASKRSPRSPIACGIRTNRSRKTFAAAACARRRDSCLRRRKSPAPARRPFRRRSTRSLRCPSMPHPMAPVGCTRSSSTATGCSCRIADGKCRIQSRNGKDWTDPFSGVADALARLPVESAWIDGEIVVADAKGRTSFQALQNALSSESGPRPFYYAFDLPYLNGYDLRGAALEDRKALLRKIVGDGPAVRYSDHVEGNGQGFFDQACQMRLEGIISKRMGSTYQAVRGRGWQKIKCGMRQEFVIGGYTDPQGARIRLRRAAARRLRRRGPALLRQSGHGVRRRACSRRCRLR